MSIGRCSSCHCYSRNCPVGQPNHKNVAAIGASCTMNSLGRHYRDPNNPDNPTCNYEANGTRCTFFASGHEFASLPYPEDISYGPVSESNSELSSILALLQQQRADQQQQAQDMQALKEQVSSLMACEPSLSTGQATTPATTVVTTSTYAPTFPTPSLNQAPTLSTQSFAPSLPVPGPTPNFIPVAAPQAPNTRQSFAPQLPPPVPGSAPNLPPASIPQSISAAASSLAASLQACLGSGSTYGGLTMDHLRSNPVISNQASAVLSEALQEVAPLQASTNMKNQVNTVD